MQRSKYLVTVCLLTLVLIVLWLTRFQTESLIYGITGSCSLLDARGAASKEGVLTNNAERGRVGCVRYLLKKGANPNEGQDKGYTPLMAAAQFGHLDAVELLVKAGADINFNTDGTTPLCRALQNRSASLQLVSLLVKSGATFAWNSDSTALNCLADVDGRQEKFEYLLRNDVLGKINQKQKAAALQAVSWSEARELVLQGIDPNLRGSFGETVLMRATKYNQCETVQFLLMHAADPELKDQDGKSAADLARNARNALESASRTQSNLSQLPYALAQNRAITEMLLSPKSTVTVKCSGS